MLSGWFRSAATPVEKETTIIKDPAPDVQKETTIIEDKPDVIIQNPPPK